MPAQVIHLTPDESRLRVVRAVPAGLVLTDGARLALYVPAETGVRLRGQTYRYARRVRGGEL